MSAYLRWMAGGTVFIFVLYGLYCYTAGKKRGVWKHAWLTALLALLFSLRIAPELARVGYALMTLELDIESYGMEALKDLFDIEITRFSFFCGGAGVVLGVLLANALTRRDAMWKGMDAFAPFGAMLVALFRLGEIAAPFYGGGHFLSDGNPLAFFPFALKIETAGGYTEWVWAVCVASAFCALACAILAFVLLRKGLRAGTVFTVTFFYLCIAQIICESWRSEGIFWLFVHAEQVLCALTAAGILLFWIARGERGAAFRRWSPFIIMLICAGLAVAAEFAIDGKLFDIAPWICYVFLICLVLAMGYAGYLAAKNWEAGGKRLGVKTR